MSLHFGRLEGNEGVIVAPLSSRAAFSCGGAGESSVHGGRRPHFFLCPHFSPRDNDACCWHRERCIRNCLVHSTPVPGTSIEPPYSCRWPWFSGRGGAWESESNEGMTIGYLAAVVCLGSSSSHSNTGIVAVACLGSSSSHRNTGLAAVACLDSSSSYSNTGLSTVACVAAAAATATLVSRR